MINHNLLLSKLKAIGVHGPLLLWFASFLLERSQIVGYRSFMSRIINGTMGRHIVPEEAMSARDLEEDICHDRRIWKLGTKKRCQL